jgi:hypothetical protein
VLSLKIEGMKRFVIYDDRVITLHDEALGHFVVTLWLRRERLARWSEPSPNLTEGFQIRETDQAILSALIAEQFASMRDIARLTYRPRSIVHSYLTRSLCFTVRHLHWIQDLTINESKHNRARDSQA